MSERNIAISHSQLPNVAPAAYQLPTVNTAQGSYQEGTLLSCQHYLKDNVVNHPLEQKADIMIDRGMTPSTSFIQRKCAHCEEEEQLQRKPISSFIQRKEADGKNMASDSASNKILSTKGSGNIMDAHTKSFMESRFGADFSHVKIHTDSTASELSNELNAQAFTVGNDIYFNKGKYAPESNIGKHLLAHELTHTVQQHDGVIHQQTNHAETIIQRKQDCSLDHLTTECGNASASCMTVQKDYCAKKYPTASDIDTLHANAVSSAEGERAKIPNAVDNLLYFLAGSGKEKVMPVDIFKKHSTTKDQLEKVHRPRFIEGASKRLADGRLKAGGTAEMVWTDTANAFAGAIDDLALSVGGYTICSKVIVSASKKGSDTEINFDSWTVQAFDCYNWDPGKGIGSLFGGVTDNDLCCLENAGKGKHFRIRTDPWKNDYAPSLLKAVITSAGSGDATTGETTPAPPPPKKKSDSR